MADAPLVRRRERAIRRLAGRLARGGWPRAEMALLVALTGVAGLLASFAMLRAGVGSMALRYPAAVALAYLVFLLLLGLWLHWRRRSGDAFDLLDVPDPGGAGAWPADAPFEAGGGEFGGGGASGSFGDAAGGGLSPGDALDLDDAAVVLIPLALAAAGLLGALWVVWAAPVLFAELLLDAAIAAGLYRRLRGGGGGHWLRGALRRTWAPALGLAIALGLAGLAMGAAAPEARTIGEFLHAG